MIRALWDDLLVRVQAWPRAARRRAAVLPLCGLAFYALFCGLFYAGEQVDARLGSVSRAAVAMGIGFERPRISYFPPAASLDALWLPLRALSGDAGRTPALILRDVRLEMRFFPARLTVQARLAGGELHLLLTPSAFFRPDACAVRAEAKGLDLAELGAALTGDGALLRLMSGSLSASCDASVPLRDGRPVFGGSGGGLSLTLHGGALEHSLPMLRAPRLEGLNGRMELVWKKNALELRQCALNNAVLQLQAEGRATLAPAAGDSRLDLRAVLRLAPEQLREELTPARTFQSFTSRGEARVRISGAARRPSIELQS